MKELEPITIEFKKYINLYDYKLDKLDPKLRKKLLKLLKRQTKSLQEHFDTHGWDLTVSLITSSLINDLLDSVDIEGAIIIYLCNKLNLSWSSNSDKGFGPIFSRRDKKTMRYVFYNANTNNFYLKKKIDWSEIMDYLPEHITYLGIL